MDATTPKRGERVSISRFEDAPDEQPALDLDEIRRYQPGGTRDDRAGYTVPHYVHVALDSVVAVLTPWRTSITHVGVWALSRGVERLRLLTDVLAIRDAREDLLRRGCDVSFVNEWRYVLAPHGSRPDRLYLRRLDPADIGQCSGMAAGLGMEISTVAALAIIAAIVDLPLRGDVPRLIETELRDWLRALRRRAVLVGDLRTRAAAAEPQHRTSWAAISAEEQT